MNRHRCRYAWFLSFLPVVLFAGCSSTSGSRLGGTSQAKSIAVVGDRPVSVASGEPGGQVVAEADPEPKLNLKARISGRVIDDQGEPVPNATVRLADGNLKGGKDIRATTDQSGGFTLNGLRPGSTYAIVAEDDQGLLTGRATAKTAATGVEISVLSEEAAAKAATRRSARPARARPISNRDDLGDGSAEKSLEPTFNVEDVAPPAEKPEPLDPGPLSEGARPQLIAPQSTTGWQNTKSATVRKPRSSTDDSETVATSAGTPSRRSKTVTTEPEPDEEEGQNPLPPAIEPGQDDASLPRKPSSARSKPVGKPVAKPQAPKPDSGEMSLAPEAKVVPERDLIESPAPMVVAAAERPPAASGPATGTNPSGALPEPGASPLPGLLSEALPSTATTSGPPEMPSVGPEPAPSLVTSGPPPGLPPASPSSHQDVFSTTPASQPVFVSQPQAQPAAVPTLAVSSNPKFPEQVTTSPSTLEGKPAAEPFAPQGAEGSLAKGEDDDLAAPVPPGPKMKWGDLAANDPKSKVIIEPTRMTMTAAFVKRFRPTPVESKKTDSAIALCSYDAKLRKIKDFRLPDLEGNPVRFQDLDADYVLLDFWGTWCSPCLESIPHLIELQKKYGPKRLTVVGIACEEAPPNQRKAKVDELSRKLGINYPVLLSTMDGKPCPVQQALAIQAMPTMILLDRKGQILWRSTGSTPANETRLDRVLASQMSWSETARR